MQSPADASLLTNPTVHQDTTPLKGGGSWFVPQLPMSFQTMSQPISEPFGTTTNPLGLSVYFLFSFMDSHMLPVLFLYLILSIPPVYILISDH